MDQNNIAWVVFVQKLPSLKFWISEPFVEDARLSFFSFIVTLHLWTFGTGEICIRTTYNSSKMQCVFASSLGTDVEGISEGTFAMKTASLQRTKKFPLNISSQKHMLVCEKKREEEGALSEKYNLSWANKYLSDLWPHPDTSAAKVGGFRRAQKRPPTPPKKAKKSSLSVPRNYSSVTEAEILAAIKLTCDLSRSDKMIRQLFLIDRRLRKDQKIQTLKSHCVMTLVLLVELHTKTPP